MRCSEWRKNRYGHSFIILFSQTPMYVAGNQGRWSSLMFRGRFRGVLWVLKHPSKNLKVESCSTGLVAFLHMYGKKHKERERERSQSYTLEHYFIEAGKIEIL